MPEKEQRAMQIHPLVAIELLRLGERDKARKVDQARLTRRRNRAHARRQTVTGDSLQGVAAPVPCHCSTA
jgi:hypothetical protein